MKFNFEKLVEARTSRIYSHIISDRTWAIISAYRGENSEELNSRLLQELKNDVKPKYGFIEFISRWSGDEDVDERALLIPNIESDFATQLGSKYKQASIIYCENGACYEICTTPFTDMSGDYINKGEVVRTFNLDTETPMNITKAEEIFSHRLSGACSKPIKGSNSKPFTLAEIDEVVQPKPSSFRGGSQFRIY